MREGRPKVALHKYVQINKDGETRTERHTFINEILPNDHALGIIGWTPSVNYAGRATVIHDIDGYRWRGDAFDCRIKIGDRWVRT